jgi:hypothetical protein
MNMRYLSWLILAVLLLAGAGARADDAAGVAMRRGILASTPAELGFASDEAFPTVYGLLMEYRVGEHTVSVVCLRDGTASLYTTSGFGIIGGQAYDFVRTAAVKCVKLAETHATGSVEAPAQPLPGEAEVYFYYLTYDGIRVHIAPQTAVEDGSSPRAPLYEAAQVVQTLLRRITEIQAERDAAKQ